MKGKFVNLLLSLLNILVGIIVLVYSVKVPKDLTVLTVQENEVVNILLIAIYVVIGITAFLNLLGYFKNKSNYGLGIGYRVFFFTAFFALIKLPFIAIFPFVSAFFIIKNIIKENIREIESVSAISIISATMIATVIIDIMIYFYPFLGAYVLAKKNENQIKYSDSFFKYITELDGYDKYINVKIDGKYGYLNTKGEPVTSIKQNFLYDYASPFVNINVYDKEFQIALVSIDGISKIIMKNGRELQTYVSETSSENYEQKIKELEEFYYNNIKMKDEMEFEIDTNNSIFLNAAKAYNTTSENYTYKYDFNNEYDIKVVQSNMGLKDKYYLSKKNDSNYNLQLNCENLDYDENYLYLYRDGTIPFFNPEKDEQGWFSARGSMTMAKGNVQILEKIDDVLLCRKDGQIAFFNQKDDATFEQLSESYRDIFIQDDRYIVKNQNDKYTIIGKDYKKIIDEEYDYVDTTLLSSGLYLFGNINNDIVEFNDYDYADLNFVLIDYNGIVLRENLEQVYSKYYKISDDDDIPYVTRYNEFNENLKNFNFRFIGDKFYKK